MLHSKQVKSPTSKYTVTSPRKVTLTQSKVALQKDPPPQTIITQSKKMIIEANYNILEEKPYEQLFDKVKSSYSPEPVRIKSVTSRINSPNLAKKVSEEYTSSKVDFMQQRTRGQSSKLSGEGSSAYYQDRDKQNVPIERLQGIRSMTSIVKRINVPALYTTPDDIYYGQFNQNNQYHGNGRYTFKACGVLYQGQFLNGEISGYGRLLYQSPSNIHPVIYQGQFLHAKKHGRGVYYYETPIHYYRGQWQNDMKQGQGVYESPEESYQGLWSKNKKHGRGKLVNRKNNTTFTGMFINDYFTQGQILYANGDLYIGTFHLNKKQGTGTYHYSSRNQVYTGQFANDLRHGKGMVKMANGDEFSGVWRHGRVDQSMNCTYKWANGAVFSGWFKNGVPDKGTVKNQRQEYQYTSTASFIAY